MAKLMKFAPHDNQHKSLDMKNCGQVASLLPDLGRRLKKITKSILKTVDKSYVGTLLLQAQIAGIPCYLSNIWSTSQIEVFSPVSALGSEPRDITAFTPGRTLRLLRRSESAGTDKIWNRVLVTEQETVTTQIPASAMT